ncbi:DUF6578 domain-containing protein [Streptomyces sp. ITFR-6]|uniref:DUF6578 domain-containing protein n=1 Tax=Streptomyces sp. ITFR-6 TaxID=3075197 RepID=UPI00288B97F7|nr:DUF6578 domain-containing protein [Streptomyces sp. ITFR-6]WNI31326.1 hypothetical protein RLT59_22960 [Streptomyces sp. ITFR-6]
MALTIWVDDWQMQCCGDTFRPGDAVSWQLLEVDPGDYADIVGSDRAAEIDFREEHHGPGEEQPLTPLRVVDVTEVHCRYGVPSGSTAEVLRPVPGSTELVPVVEADGWAKARPHTMFAGYLVTAERPAAG